LGLELFAHRTSTLKEGFKEQYWGWLARGREKRVGDDKCRGKEKRRAGEEWERHTKTFRELRLVQLCAQEPK
jgi:hypothetical protein